jgi:hypothetical protein
MRARLVERQPELSQLVWSEEAQAIGADVLKNGYHSDAVQQGPAPMDDSHWST